MPRKPYHHGDLKNALIDAGIEILSREGIGALSLRRVAKRAGVSHAAPYAHFADKQALVAAIATEGYRLLHERLRDAVERHAGDPPLQLLEGAWAYASFALEKPAHFRITLSGLVERQKDYPAYVEISRRSFDLVAGVVGSCQAAGLLAAGPADEATVAVWSVVHGFVSLLLEGQVPHAVSDREGPRKLLARSLHRMLLGPVDSLTGPRRARGTRDSSRRSARRRGAGPR